MPIAFVLDEQLRGPLWPAILLHNHTSPHLIDATRVGDPSDLPLGTQDPDILLWAERERRIVVSFDRKTMPGHLAAHLASGHRSPGVFLIRRRASLSDVVDYLALATVASDADDWKDLYHFIP
jgi:hypothetical protein